MQSEHPHLSTVAEAGAGSADGSRECLAENQKMRPEETIDALMREMTFRRLEWSEFSCWVFHILHIVSIYGRLLFVRTFGILLL